MRKFVAGNIGVNPFFTMFCSFNVVLDPSFLHGVEVEEVAAGPALSDTSHAQGDDSSGSRSSDVDEHENGGAETRKK